MFTNMLGFVLTFFLGVLLQMACVGLGSIFDPHETREPLFPDIISSGLSGKAEGHSNEFGLNSPDTIFDGQHFKIVKDEKGNFGRISQSDGEHEFCSLEIDLAMRNKLRRSGFEGETKYFRFPAEELEDGRTNKFTLKVDRARVDSIDIANFEEFESHLEYVCDNSLYLLKNGNYEFLVMVAKDLAMTGLSVNYWNITVLELRKGGKYFKFDSLSGNPKMLRIGDNGVLYYVQVDDYNPYSLMGKESVLRARLVSFDTAEITRNEFEYDCKELGHFLAKRKKLAANLSK